MTIHQQIYNACPQLDPSKSLMSQGIEIWDDGDGDVYIGLWNSKIPMPETLKIGK